MAKKPHIGVEEARRRLPRLLEQAAAGKQTIITRHGRPLAQLRALDTYGAAGRQQSILPLVGTGGGLWGKRSPASVRKMRSEWSP
jgi:prevent-host-death family protein